MTATKMCSKKCCTVHQPQPYSEFVAKNGKYVATCATCRAHKTKWQVNIEQFNDVITPAERREIDRRFAGMVIRRDGNRPAFLAEINSQTTGNNLSIFVGKITIALPLFNTTE